MVQNIRSWSHSGFSVDQSVEVEAQDSEGLQRLIEYFLRCPFSQARMIEVTCLRQGFGRPAGEGKVIYKTGDNRLGRFPEAASEDLLAGPKRNFQVFDPLDFLAEVTQHIPDPGGAPDSLLWLVFQQEPGTAGQIPGAGSSRGRLRTGEVHGPRRQGSPQAVGGLDQAGV